MIADFLVYTWNAYLQDFLGLPFLVVYMELKGRSFSKIFKIFLYKGNFLPRDRDN